MMIQGIDRAPHGKPKETQRNWNINKLSAWACSLPPVSGHCGWFRIGLTALKLLRRTPLLLTVFEFLWIHLCRCFLFQTDLEPLEMLEMLEPLEPLETIKWDTPPQFIMKKTAPSGKPWDLSSQLGQELRSLWARDMVRNSSTVSVGAWCPGEYSANVVRSY